MSKWKTLDTLGTIKQRNQMREQTTSANIATVPVPLGPPLRRQPSPKANPPYKNVPAKVSNPKKKK